VVTRDNLRAFLATELGVDLTNVDDTSPLFSTGLVDATALTSLTTFLEDTAHFEMSPSDVNLDNLDSIERILSFVTQATSS
jgi:acyl carrier protein